MKSFLTFHLITVLLAYVATVNSRNVVIDVKAAWSRYTTSFIAEVSEFLFEQSPSAFWKFVDSVCEQSDKVELALTQNSQDAIIELHSLAFDIGTSIVPKQMHSLMDTMLGLGAYAPAVRFFESISEEYSNPCDGKAFAVIYPSGKVVCDAKELQSAVVFEVPSSETAVRSDISEEDQSLNTWDHIYDPTTPSTAKVTGHWSLVK